MLMISNMRCEHLNTPLGISARSPRFSWEITSPQNNIIQKNYRIQVSAEINFSSLCWDSKTVESDAQHEILYAGDALRIRTEYYWRLKIKTQDGQSSDWSNAATFETGFFSIHDWDSLWFPYFESIKNPSVNHLRKEFEIPVEKTVKRARAYIASTCGFYYEDTFRMNLYVLRMNGKKVGMDLYNPGQLSNRRTRALYRTYDIKSHLTQGSNAVGIIYASARISLQIFVEFTDGTTSFINTGSPKWKKTGLGPYIHLWKKDENSYAYGGRGEVYDAREEFNGWDLPGFDDSHWVGIGEKLPSEQPVQFAEGSSIASAPEILKAQMQSVQTSKVLPPQKIHALENNKIVVDFGQNFNGHESIKIKGQCGSRITMRFAERLHKDGSVNFTTTWGGAKEASIHEDVYIKKSDEIEEYSPHFANHSFRYIEISGLSEPLNIEDISANVVHSTVMNDSSFASSNSRAQRLHEMCVWTSLSNLMSVPTDCPGRERQGWLASGGLTAAADSVNFDMRLFYEKWFDDIADSQNWDGQLPLVCPSNLFNKHGVDMLQYSLFLSMPWEIYMAYGDKVFLKSAYPMLKKLITFISSFPMRDGLSHGHTIWNDWIAESTVNGDFLENACICWSLRSFAKIASELGHNEDASNCLKLAEKRKKAINRHFLKNNDHYGNDNLQTENTCALAFGIVPDSYREKFFSNLLNDLTKHNHLTLGVFTFLPFINLLSTEGHNDIIWRLIQSDQPRTVGYWLVPEHDLTTIPELWDQWDSKFQHANHHDFTLLNAWFFKELAGLKPSLPGYKKFTICPYLAEGVDDASEVINSVYGEIESAWQRQGENFTLKVKIPVNTSAEIFIPKSKNIIINQMVNFQPLRCEKLYDIFVLGSGEYTIQSILINK